MEIIAVCDLKKYYETGSQTVKALDNVNLTVNSGEFVAVVGASGSGKTTLLNLLGGIDYPTEGRVIIDGQEIYLLNDEERTIFRRRKIGFVFQAYNLIPILNVYDNVTLPMELDGKRAEPSDVEDILNKLGILDKKYAFPHQLSGGQQQRAAIARALVSKPVILLADEPTGNLDSTAGEEVLQLLLDAKEVYNQTILMITHNGDYARTADRIVQLKDGRIV
ncbi:MAG: ABC transporter ATP-binding protein [Clostridiales Family XIII bacterium]|jgi:putative ABC transport system ATP-binding protein|nr:ABC transporter ATP-binding protein [Clostridiales Family XIII bacterium]